MHIMPINTLTPGFSENSAYRFLNTLWTDRAITKTHRTLFISKISESMALGFEKVILEMQMHLENISMAVDREPMPNWFRVPMYTRNCVEIDYIKTWTGAKAAVLFWFSISTFKEAVRAMRSCFYASTCSCHF